MELKIYLISQSVNYDYDTYDSAVVVARNKYFARRTHPDGNLIKNESELRKQNTGSWVNKFSDITIKEIGTANAKQLAGVICASFNAG